MNCDVNEQFSGKSRSIRYNPLIVKKLGTHQMTYKSSSKMRYKRNETVILRAWLLSKKGESTNENCFSELCWSYLNITTTSRLQVYCKNGVIRISAKLYKTSFNNISFQCSSIPPTLIKRLSQLFSCKFCKTVEYICSMEHLRESTSATLCHEIMEIEWFSLKVS